MVSADKKNELGVISNASGNIYALFTNPGKLLRTLPTFLLTSKASSPPQEKGVAGSVYGRLG